VSVKIGNVEVGNGAYLIAEVWADRGGVRVMPVDPNSLVRTVRSLSFDTAQEPAAARNFAALLVRAADEVERMRARPAEKE
jgi:hypothetical protein